MTNKEFARLRKKLDKTQKQMAQLLGVSIKAVHSYEQGWRSIPTHAERQMLFLVSNRRGNSKVNKPCWAIKKCPPKKKQECPAWEFKSGKLCWFINGTICDGIVYKDWKEKMKSCRSCKVFANIL
ncbi:MAG: helix-turn-helix domain-containing protein [Deltaproteobacteria bacterium]|jgi:transcriptional regulator with XRE-family HTH domain|nr:helix-turn-helix domain-containing protein [Deltaproteobacteria bacterium]MBW2239598.1 helix-turn-helix domain-containing protein [Deltaproteobacteria bacterium]MBW2571064.1 helix-turn-helix domain-containing protein [Deltaproteobacteria bacterium]MBW2669114.1 helix-turn-helix domain-containing protein [Deltaproteobacteria bacterium]